MHMHTDPLVARRKLSDTYVSDTHNWDKCRDRRTGEQQKTQLRTQHDDDDDTHGAEGARRTAISTRLHRRAGTRRAVRLRTIQRTWIYQSAFGFVGWMSDT